MLNERSEAEVLAEKIRHVLGLRDVPPIIEIAKACGATKQAVNGWKKTGRISKGNLGTLSEMTRFPLWWWTDASVAFDDYLRDGLDRPPINRPSGLASASDSVTNVTGITPQFDQALWDALRPEQRRVVEKVSVFLVGEFTRMNEPVRERGGKERWKDSQDVVQKRGAERRPPTKRKAG